MDHDGHNACMDSTQAKIIELLREVHLLALREVERLNLRIAELASLPQNCSRWASDLL
jgi:hypothetical protein